MSRVKNVGRELLNLKLEDETGLSHSCSIDAAVSRPDALRLFPVRAVCGYGGVWVYGVSLLSEPEDGGYMGVWHIGIAVPTYIQDCVRTNGLEYGRCHSGLAIDSSFHHGVA